MSEINPYQSPLADSVPPKKPSAEVGIWRKGSRLMVHRNTRLPDICLKTGTPADRRIPMQVGRFSRNNKRKYRIEIPVSHAWWNRHVFMFRLAVGLLLFAGASGIVWGVVYDAPPLPPHIDLALFVMLFVGIILLFTNQFVTIGKSTETHVSLECVHRDVLARFPEWPG